MARAKGRNVAVLLAWRKPFAPVGEPVERVSEPTVSKKRVALSALRDSAIYWSLNKLLKIVILISWKRKEKKSIQKKRKEK